MAVSACSSLRESRRIDRPRHVDALGEEGAAELAMARLELGEDVGHQGAPASWRWCSRSSSARRKPLGGVGDAAREAVTPRPAVTGGLAPAADARRARAPADQSPPPRRVDGALVEPQHAVETGQRELTGHAHADVAEAQELAQRQPERGDQGAVAVDRGVEQAAGEVGAELIAALGHRRLDHALLDLGRAPAGRRHVQPAATEQRAPRVGDVRLDVREVEPGDHRGTVRLGRSRHGSEPGARMDQRRGGELVDVSVERHVGERAGERAPDLEVVDHHVDVVELEVYRVHGVRDGSS
ncbi:MAG: hypothetical protein IPK07_24525 [Deltaproteobacteria bacterium]|nr:hypothetical protein [Deltaproteobacteria bacterium]